jgi:phosphopentomutase
MGIGDAPDAQDFSCTGANTYAHMAAASPGLELPFLQHAGLGNLTAIPGVPPTPTPAAVIARLTELSPANDTPTGHWELFGVPTTTVPPIYADGFPAAIIEPFECAIGCPVLGNCAIGGTEAIKRFGPTQLATARPIVYNGGLAGDSVFQIAAHVGVIPLELLYHWCEVARAQLTGSHAIGRVIARPYQGTPRQFTRLPSRRDWALPPPSPTMLELLHSAGVHVTAIGKIEDIFCGRGIDQSYHDGDNESASLRLRQLLTDPARTQPELLVVNLVDFDSRYGHPRDPQGMAAATVALDRLLAELASLLLPGDRLILTADHGNDPTWQASISHTRERVPLLFWGPDLAGVHLPDTSMSALAATLAALYALPYAGPGQVQHKAL